MTAAPLPRRVSVAPHRLAGWLGGFAERHGEPWPEVQEDRLVLRAPDGAIASIRLVWGPLPDVGLQEGDPLSAAVDAFTRPRRIGVLIARRQAHAVGVFEGDSLVTGRHGRHYVQGRTKAGGWSQQRYARRRASQADRSFDAAAADVTAILLPEVGRLEALVIGGDRTAAATVLAAPRLEPLRDPALRRGLGVFRAPDPNATVLAGFADTFRRVRIDLNELA